MSMSVCITVGAIKLRARRVYVSIFVTKVTKQAPIKSMLGLSCTTCVTKRKMVIGHFGLKDLDFWKKTN